MELEIAAPRHLMEKAQMARLVLTVDDSPSIRPMMQLTLSGEGYEVKQTTDGVEALEFARNHSADLVLTDINMPRMDGFTLIRELHASRIQSRPNAGANDRVDARQEDAWERSGGYRLVGEAV